MFIKKIEIRGFKSYGEMTNLDKFDRYFNAITGLNGSGKSNIFDAICFCLGLHSLKSMRVNHTKDLIFKEGTGNVTEAHVSIIFDNSDNENQPIGFESIAEISITRTIKVSSSNSKYHINGSISTKEKVEELLASVRINMKNPTFIILQGRIKQVINQTNIETLGMVEEVIGTRNYDKKKADAVKTIELKNQKLAEIEELITNTIKPYLEECERAKKDYVQYETIKKKYDYIKKRAVAYKYYRQSEKHLQTEKLYVDSKVNLETLTNEVENSELQVTELKKRIEELEAEKNNEELKSFKNSLKKKETEKHAAETKVKLLHKAVTEGEKEKEKLQREKINKERDAEKQNLEYDKNEQTCKRLQEAFDDAKKQLKLAEDGQMAAATGRQVQEDGRTMTIQDQLTEAQAEKMQTATIAKELKMNIRHNENKLKELKNKLDYHGNKGLEDQQKLKKLENEKDKLEKNLSRLNYDPTEFDELQIEAESLGKNIRLLKNQANSIRNNYKLQQFEYDPPTNFQTKKVFGMLHELFKVKEEKYALAVESCFQGSSNVVVDTDETASILLQTKNCLKSTYNFQCMNKLLESSLPSGSLHQARKISKDVYDLFDLLEFDKKFKNAVQRGFQPTIVCPNSDLAYNVCRKINVNTVSMDGDTFTPAGLISGGSAQKVKKMDGCMKLYDILSELRPSEVRLHFVQEKLQSNKNLHEQFENMQQNLTELKNQIELQKEVVTHLASNELKQEFDILKLELNELKSKLKDVEEKGNIATQHVNEFTEQLKNSENTKKKLIKEASTKLEKAKKQEAIAKKEFESFKSNFQNIQEKIISFREDIGEYDEKCLEIERLNEEKLNEILLLGKQIDTIKNEIESIVEELQNIEKSFGNTNAEVERYKIELNTLTDNITSNRMTVLAEKRKTDKYKSEMNQLANILKNMEEEYIFIGEDKEKFGVSETDYDFRRTLPDQLKKEESKLKTDLDKCAKETNIRAAESFIQKKKEYDDLISKRETVLADKRNLQQFIDTVDKEKDQAIERACKSVNKDFNSIFSMLLPNASAELQAFYDNEIDGKINGLKIRVALGGDWKESLSELSGGQKSLMSLSLLLALLRCKPCPFYILDEIDAALDTSHTQNVGEVIHTFFKASQFLIISLKQNLFASADVLFKVSNVNGVSKVERVANKKK